MGIYYYVEMMNPLYYCDDNSRYQKTETGKLLENIAGNCSLGYSEPSALALHGIKSKPCTRKKKGLLGIEYTESYSVDYPFFIICEENGNYLEEVVTGKRYEKITNYGYGNENYSDKLKLRIVRELPTSRVAEILRGLSEYELRGIQRKMNELDRGITTGYQYDMQRIRREKAQKDSDDSYIKSFRKKYGK